MVEASKFSSHKSRVWHWLGLYPNPPEGLHGPRRGNIVRRHTSETERGSHFMGQALAKAYPRSREMRLMQMLRPQRLDDAFWRQVYALMVQGGPIALEQLIESVADLTDDDRKMAEARAATLYHSWDLTRWQEAQDDG